MFVYFNIHVFRHESKPVYLVCLKAEVMKNRKGITVIPVLLKPVSFFEIQ